MPRPHLLNVLRGLRPSPRSLQQRLADFPTSGLELDRPVTIRWNPHQVPFITAETDRDLFYTLGLVHMHLRGAQIALFRMLFSGRLAEMLGPAAVEADHFLRILDYGRAAAAIEARLPARTRAWVEAFVGGLNAYQRRATLMPPEFGLLGLKAEPFTVRDIIAGARVGGTDFTWLTQFSLLKHRAEPGFARLWQRLLAIGGVPTPSARVAPLFAAGRAGSNAFVVAPGRSASGGALIANDPHLSLFLPNLWLIAGVRSPSLHVVGFMICGLPVFAIGRNPVLAWGGTNLRAASTDLYDVSALPAEQLTSEEITLKVRGWRPVRRTVRRTPLGPVITDAKLLQATAGPPVAMRWVGHEPTDEFTAFFEAAQADTPEAFRQAFATYGVSGQNMLFADRAGHIGQVLAVAAPRRPPFPLDHPLLDGSDPATHWQGFDTVLDLPWVLDPPEGLLASANNKPAGDNGRISFTYAARDRVERIETLLRRKPQLTVDDLAAIQMDVVAPGAARLAQGLAARLRALPPACVAGDFLAVLESWDGAYDESSLGAAAFETLVYHLVARLNGRTSAEGLPIVLGQWNMLDRFLLADVDALADEERRQVLTVAATAARRDWCRHPSWGEMHRLKLGHVLARLPVIGRRFRIGDFPTGGSRQTPMKMSHGLVRDRHGVAFGSMARHISDLSDPDANWFLLLGGQDGWLGSAQFCDQWPLWRQQRFLRVPLSEGGAAAEFPITMVLTPATG